MEKNLPGACSRPTYRPSPAPLQRAACRPGRQAGARRRPQRAPRTCSPPRRSPRPVTSWIAPPLSLEPPRHPSPLQLLPLALPRHDRRHHRRAYVVAVLPVTRASSHRVQELRRCPLHRASRAPSARNARVHRNDLARTAIAGDPLQRRRRSGPSPATPRASSHSL